MRPQGDRELIRIVDAALADSTARSGTHLFCHPGCTPCCHGVFTISSLDAARLQDGLHALEASDAARANRVKVRVADAMVRLSADYPGDVPSGRLGEDEASRERFEDFANEERCPVLDPESGTCDLYSARPMTCRVFGPPVRSEDGLGICELCFRGATEQQIAAAEMRLPPPELEAELTAPLGEWTTIIAFALRTQPEPVVSESKLQEEHA